MKIANVTMTSVTPYSQNRYHETDKLKGESAGEYEERTWKQRAHVNGNGKSIIIPAQQLKNCLCDAAKYLSMQIEGKGKQTYTKYFQTGILVDGDVSLNITTDDVKCEKVFMQMPTPGKSRVNKFFPIIQKWSGTAKFLLLEDAIPKDIFETHIKKAGIAVGIGRFRIRLGGNYGRFKVDKIKWEEVEVE